MTQVVTNVPGPREAVTVAGAELEDIVFWAPARSNVGLTASLFTYGNNLRVAIQCDAAFGRASDIVNEVDAEIARGMTLLCYRHLHPKNSSSSQR